MKITITLTKEEYAKKKAQTEELFSLLYTDPEEISVDRSDVEEYILHQLTDNKDYAVDILWDADIEIK